MHSTLLLPLPIPPPCPPFRLPQLGDPAPKGHSYIASSYVKLVESAGARAVPILCDMSKEEVERRFKVGLEFVFAVCQCGVVKLIESAAHHLANIQARFGAAVQGGTRNCSKYVGAAYD